MPIRTTAVLVAVILEVDNTIGLDPFIFTASELVTEVCISPTYSPERMELIERWLAAHFYCIRDPRSTNERAGSVGATYESKVDLYLAETRYGQQAMLLDTQGGLAALNRAMLKGGRRVSAKWLGVDLTNPVHP